MAYQGIVERLRFAEYAMDPAMNCSTLEWAQYSMEHLRAAKDGLIEDGESKALTFGRALHARLLEPDVFVEEFKVGQPCQAELKSGANKGAECGCSPKYYVGGQWLCGKHAPSDEQAEVNLITQAEADSIEAMFARLRQHKVVNLIRQHGGFEASVFADLCGVPCKGRIDKLIVDKGCPDTIVDLKTCDVGGASRRAFAEAVKRYQYHFRAAVYSDLVEAITGQRPTFLWIAVEKKYPYALSVRQATEDDLAIGREQYEDWLLAYKRAVETDEWPGYSDDIEMGGLPEYYVDNWRQRQAYAPAVG